MRLVLQNTLFLFSALCLLACDVSVTPGGIEDRHEPGVIEDLAPMPEGYLEFAAQTTKLFFDQGHEGIQGRLHPAMQGLSNVKWTALEKIASDKADFETAEYYGHGFGEEDGLDFVLIQFKIPFEGGYNIVKMIMPLDEPCCRVAGLEVNVEKIKSFKLR